jgi:Tfp pilus assembly protein PilP
MTPTVIRPFRIGLAVAVLVALMAGGCGKEEPAPAPVVKKAVPKEDAKAAEAAQSAAAAGVKPPPVALYSPAGKRDPFLPFLKMEKREIRADLAALPPLQRYELGELRFVGVIWGADVTRALLEDSEGKGYTVTVGTKIGRGGGVVTRITDGELFVREEFRDYAGTMVTRESSLKLQTGGGK